MSELIQKNDNRATIRWKLMTSASAAAMLVSAYGAGAALAADSNASRPTLWIELGGQLSQLSDPQQAFSPAFLSAFTIPAQDRALDVQHRPRFAVDGQMVITFQPKESDWVFSGGVKIGRSAANKHSHQQTPNALIPVPQFTVYGSHFGGYTKYPNNRKKFADGTSTRSEQHTILDFLAGKDVGLGMLGARGSSVISGGVRIAQFTSRSNVNLSGVPDLQYPTLQFNPTGHISNLIAEYILFHTPVQWHRYIGNLQSRQSFHGLGPEIAWNAPVPVAGNDTGNGELTLDWGANFSVLFGRQRASGQRQTQTTHYYRAFASRVNGGRNGIQLIQWVNGGQQKTGGTPVLHLRVRDVTVPNLGGSIGMSFQYSDAKISFGYRADYFFNAVDGGIDTRKEENRAFFGPYASISIGLGD